MTLPLDLVLLISKEELLVLGTLCGAILSLVAVARLTNRYVFRPVHAAWDHLSDMHEKLEVVIREFSTNGGTSLRDVINRIEGGVVLLEQRWRGVWNIIPVGMFETNAEGLVMFVSRAFTIWTGRPADEMLGEGWVAMVHPQDRADVQSAWNDAVIQRRFFEYRLKYIDYSGALAIPVQIRAYPMFGADSTYLGHIGVASRTDMQGIPLSFGGPTVGDCEATRTVCAK